MSSTPLFTNWWWYLVVGSLKVKWVNEIGWKRRSYSVGGKKGQVILILTTIHCKHLYDLHGTQDHMICISAYNSFHPLSYWISDSPYSVCNFYSASTARITRFTSLTVILYLAIQLIVLTMQKYISATSLEEKDH